MVVQVLVAQRDADDALHEQGFEPVLGVGLVMTILEAGGETAGQAENPVGGTQQKRTCVRRHGAAVEDSNHGAAFDGCKSQQVCATLCRHRGSPLLSDKALLQKNFRLFRAPMHMIRVRNAG